MYVKGYRSTASAVRLYNDVASVPRQMDQLCFAVNRLSATEPKPNRLSIVNDSSRKTMNPMNLFIVKEELVNVVR